jgi:hypothetical protein
MPTSRSSSSLEKLSPGAASGVSATNNSPTLLPEDPENGAPGNNLQKRIDSLCELGVLTREGADILHALRGLGNASAHEAEAHSETDLSTAFDVVEHLLQTVYVIPKKAARLRKSHV